ncbi:flavin-containing monooxygenase [Mangrovicella endophytica]|uniref:flavin-containing monooxygenase n=1 Tax=Mangrovicella endophytica TaxID=2066697 RepID=UPI000C9E09D9|nr:NAD(P)/FAD-dependent oxidoreductase [Mangrovicella endophytica]
MSVETVDTLVVGAGQAGVAMSEHLTRCGIPHLVLERARIAERWRSARWDSLVANGPAWHDRFPGLEFDAFDGDAFVPKEAVADYFVAYAEQFDAPIRCGVEVTGVRPLDGRPGFHVDTSQGPMEARNVIAATGAFQTPVIPAIIPAEAGVTQIHSNAYHNPGELPAGGVLVVGAGSSGVQIAEELLAAGRRVFLSVGPHDRPPRSYRGRDFVWWLGVLGKWDMQAQAPGTEHVTIAVSGARGGETIDFRRLASHGMTLTGRALSWQDGVLTFAPDLAETIARGDANYLSLLDEADAYVARNGLDLPEEPEARRFLPDPACVTDPLTELDLAAAGVSTVIWATGYTSDFRWLDVAAFDESGRPRHQRGVSSEPGIYFLGLPWLSGRGSSFIWGVWHDAKYIADHILTRRSYLDYHQARQARDGLAAPQPSAASSEAAAV